MSDAKLDKQLKRLKVKLEAKNLNNSKKFENGRY